MAIAAQSYAVRCAICARPARRGATLCAQCQAAVERARHVQKVRSEFLPHPVAGRDPGPLSGVFDPIAPRACSDRAALPGPGWGTYATLVVFGVAVCLTGYLALGELEESSNALHESLALRSVPPKHVANADGATPASATEESDAFARVDAGAAVGVVTSAARGPADRRPVREPKQVITTTMNTSDTGQEAMPPVEASATVAPPLPVEVREVPEPAPDRQQLLAIALSRCERENAVVGLFCKERARLQYCDGQWGAAPQCPVGVASNNTR